MRLALALLALFAAASPAVSEEYIDVLDRVAGLERVVETTCTGLTTYSVKFQDEGAVEYANIDFPDSKPLEDKLAELCAAPEPFAVTLKIGQNTDGSLIYQIVDFPDAAPADAVSLAELRTEIDAELAKIDTLTANVLTAEDDLMIVNFTNDGFGIAAHLWLGDIPPQRALEYLNACYMKCTEVAFRFDEPVKTGDYGMGIDPLYPEDWSLPEDAPAAPTGSTKSK